MNALSPETTVCAHLVILDQFGMHARPAALLARTARQFEADVTIHDGRTWANAKNILDILQLCVKQGEKLAIVAKGIDARRAVHAIQELFTHHRLDFDPPPPG